MSVGLFEKASILGAIRKTLKSSRFVIYITFYFVRQLTLFYKERMGVNSSRNIYFGGEIKNITILRLLSRSFWTVTDIDGNAIRFQNLVGDPVIVEGTGQ